MATRTYGSGVTNVTAMGNSAFSTHGWYGGVEISVPGNNDYGSYSGEPVPDFHKKRRAGDLIPFTAYTRYDIAGNLSGSETINHTNGTVGSVSGGIRCSGEILKSSNVMPSGDFSYLVQTAAVNAISKWDALTAVAESGKAWDMITRALRRLSDLRRGRVGKRLSHEQAVNDWLEYRYGWRTLYYDLRDISEVLNSSKDPTVAGYARTSQSYSVSDTDSTVYTHFTRHIDYTDNYSAQINGHFAGLGAGNGVVVDPIQTAWELVPYSFVVDWIVNVGNAIASWRIASLQKHTSSMGYFIIATRTIDDVRHTNYSSSVNSVSASAQLQLTWTRRIRVPQAVPTLPKFNVRLDGFKLADLYALAFQARTGKSLNLQVRR